MIQWVIKDFIDAFILQKFIEVYMKIIVFLFLLSPLVNNLYGQIDTQNVSVEQKIRKLEQGQVDALLRNDVDEMQTHWAKDYTVNNPRNTVGKASEGPIRAGTRTYSSFIRKIEAILIHGETVIVMGNETVVPNDKSPETGTTIHRRFTNIWMNASGNWLLVARQASVICEN
jgi:Domain of unknown function (DUF4440)